MSLPTTSNVKGRKVKMVKNKIVVLKNGKRIFSLKNGSPPKPSLLGETDIMLETRLGRQALYFSHVVAGNFFRHYTSPETKINAISWHGYYEKINEKLVWTPIIHLKDGHTKIDELWHLGSINAEEPFAFPLCSLFIPRNMNVDHLGVSKRDQQWHCIDVEEETDVRLDIFVLAGNLSIAQLQKSPIGFVYRFVDIEAFNTGEFEPLIDSVEFEMAHDINGHDILIRSVTSSNQLFHELEGSFSLLIHDPNDAYNRLFDRPIIQVSQIDGSYEKPKLLKDMHEEFLRK